MPRCIKIQGIREKVGNMRHKYIMEGPGVSGVKRIEAPEIAPQGSEVQIQMMFSSLNFHDWVTISGLIPWIKYPRVPLSDGCGVITAMGPNCQKFAVGDRVMPNFYPLWQTGRPNATVRKEILGETLDGTMQSFLNISEDSVVLAPPTLSDLQCATLGCAGLTAWSALMEETSTGSDDIVLLQGTGGVSLAGLKIAKAQGATVVITSSSDEKLEEARSHGADFTVNYRATPEWDAEVLKQTGGVTRVLDTGGSATLGKAVKCTVHDGVIAVIGVLSGIEPASISVIDVMQKNIGIKGITVGSTDSFERYVRYIDEKKLQPVVSDTVDCSELPLAMKMLEEGRHFGKIAIAIA